MPQEQALTPSYLDIIRDTDDLESYKHFNMSYYDQSITIGNDNKFSKTDLICGGRNGEK